MYQTKKIMKKTLLVGIATMIASYGFAQTAPQTDAAKHDKAVQKDMHKERDSINMHTKHMDDKQVDLKGDKKEIHQQRKKAVHATIHGDKADAQHHKQAVKAEKKDMQQDRKEIKEDKKEIKNDKKDVKEDKKKVPEAVK